MSGVLRGVLLTSCVLGAFACGGSEPVGTGNDDDDSSGNGGNGSGGSGNAGGTGGGDCDPRATEACNGFDDDCDGDVDEPPCTCAAGDTQACYAGRPPRTAGIGECVEGTQACGPGGVWGPCTGSVGPAPEECNGADDDCNDAIDDLGDETCGVGACQVTVAKCSGGSPNTCTPNMPTIEICDGIDNDCDQLTDETFPTAGMVCDSGMPGACAPGKLQCVVATETCVPDVSAVNESCNSVDDDCNGTVDDNVPGTGGVCDTGFPGPCGPGTVSCQNGVVDCFSNVPPLPAELCNGVDDNCDGSTDEGDPESGSVCNTGQPGACGPGVEHCLMGAISCVPNAQGTPEVCNGLDDDCDGSSDENNPGGNVACGCGGTTNCINGALVCQGGPTVYFEDNFGSGNAKGWTLGPEWSIGSATASVGCTSCPGNDPAMDHTATADNGIAGVLIGTCTNQTVHADYCLTSPNINTAAAPTVFLEFWRHLHSDYPGFMTNRIQASSNGGGNWIDVWVQPSNGQCINDLSWTKISHNLTAYKSATMRFRLCFNVGSSGVYSTGSWNVDDVTVTNTACP